jgi:tRNA (uracil-5-)-methyltransferase
VNCKYFGVCGSCNLYDGGYKAQIDFKAEREKKRFSDLYSGDFSILESKEEAYRGRAEFKIWHSSDDSISYAMAKGGDERGKFVQIDSCPMVSEHISTVMKPLLDEVAQSELLRRKLFSIEFLSGKSGNTLTTLIYHKKLLPEWEIEAKELSKKLNLPIIGRSRKQKLVLGKEHIFDSLIFDGTEYRFKHLENSFSQPNPSVNEKMVSWVIEQVGDSSDRDLIELYCGAGNFTIPLSKKFSKVLATEVAKSGIATAKENMALNGVENIAFARVSSEEFTEAIDEVRQFNRLKEVDLKSYELDTIFVDPPRAGIDSETIKLLQRFKRIIYISCNPETLHRDLNILTSSHKIESMALFDQFPYTKHLEMGTVLTAK